jgi:hypothetical protein
MKVLYVSRIFFWGLVAIAIQQEGHAQQKLIGYLGKTDFLTISSSGGLRGIAHITSGSFHRHHQASKDAMKHRIHLTKWELNMAYMKLVKRNLGVGVAIDYSQMNPGDKHLPLVPVFFSEGNISLSSQASSPVFHTIGCRLTFTTCANSSLLPIGFSNTISFGPKYYRMDMRRPAYAAVTFENGDVIQSGIYGIGDVFTNPMKLPDAPDKMTNTYWGIDVVYTAKVTYPLTRFLLFDFGVDLRLGLVFPNSKQYEKNRQLIEGDDASALLIDKYYNANFTKALFFESVGNIFSLRTGLTFAL